MEHELRKVGTSGAIMTIRRGGWLAASVLAAMLLTSAAEAGVVVQIDKSSQRMSVSVDGATRYNWAISTGRDGYGTPSGTFHPQAMMRSYFSRKYYNAPMPHAIFFYYGFAIHGTNDISRLGGPASHGCIRPMPRPYSCWSSAAGCKTPLSRFRTEALNACCCRPKPPTS